MVGGETRPSYDRTGGLEGLCAQQGQFTLQIWNCWAGSAALFLLHYSLAFLGRLVLGTLGVPGISDWAWMD